MVDGVEIGRETRWSGRRRAIQRLLLRSMRETLAEAAPVIAGIAAPPADGAVLDAARARVAAALSEAERIEAALSPREGDASDDPAAVAAAVALAAQMSLDRLGWTPSPKRK